MTVVTSFAFETWYLGLRAARRFLRVPANWISIIFFPLVQLLVFSQLYQSIVALPAFGEESYLTYLAPGQIVFAAFMAVGWGAYGMLVEYRSGYLDKLRASPIARWSILAGEIAPLFVLSAVMGAIILLASLLLGADLVTGVPGFLVIMVLCGAFGLAFSGVSFIPALLTRSEQATSALSLLIFPLLFISTAFVPRELMPGWMQSVNDWNPITSVIEAIRALMVEGFDWVAIGQAFLAIAVVGLVLQAGTLWAFRRLTR